MLKLRYYCQGGGDTQVVGLLQEIEKKRNISYEIISLFGCEDEKQVYERDFKPRATILKKRTGKSIYEELRGKGGRHRYYVSLPGTMTIVKDDQVEWWTCAVPEILQFLSQVLSQGQDFLEKLCSEEVS